MKTRQEYVAVCSTCKNRKFNPDFGIVCVLTENIADFHEDCPSYLFDETTLPKKPFRETMVLTPRSHTKNMLLVFLGILLILLGLWRIGQGNEIRGILQLISGAIACVSSYYTPSK